MTQEERGLKIIEYSQHLFRRESAVFDADCSGPEVGFRRMAMDAHFERRKLWFNLYASGASPKFRIEPFCGWSKA